MVRVVVGLFKGITLWSVKQAVSGIRFATPWAVRMILFSLTVSIQLSMLALLATYKGIEPVAQKIAEDWTQRAIVAGFPYLWETKLLKVFYAIAIITIFAGWLLIGFTAFFTVDFAYHRMF